MSTVNQQHIDTAKKARQIWGESAKSAAQYILDSSYHAADAKAVLDILRGELPEHAFYGLVAYANGRYTIGGRELQYHV